MHLLGYVEILQDHAWVGFDGEALSLVATLQYPVGEVF